MLNYDSIIVLVVILFIIISLYTRIVGPAFTFIIGVLVLGLFGILTPAEILAGFANEQILVIIMLLLIGEVIRKTGVLEGIFNRIFSRARSYNGFMSRMVLIVSGFSALLNNTPLVAIMMPYVNSWSRRNNISPSKLLIPLSFAAILGGCITLIGTSTNLIVNGFVEAQTVIPSFKSLEFYDFAFVGIPMLIIGFLYLLLFSKWLLPDKKDVLNEFTHNDREYLVETRIRTKSNLVGNTVHSAKLRNLKGLFLVEIHRNNIPISPVHPNEILQQDDMLVFAGETTMIAELVNANYGLELSEIGMYSRKTRIEAIEIVISYNSSLISRTVKEARFRSRFDSAVIGVHRNGEKISGKIGDVKLQAGDVLLLMAGNDFNQLSRDTQDFYLISRIRDYRRLKTWEIVLIIGGLLAAILFSAFKLISLFMALAIVLTTLLIVKIASPKELYKSIDFNLAAIIAMSLALGTAMMKSGVATHIADFLIHFFMPMGTIALLFGIYLITSILAAYITNKAAVALIFPIVITIAAQMEINPLPVILTMTYAAAASFLTPIGYQTNLMVYGPGGYTFKDFLKIGAPLTLIYMIVSIFILNYMYL
ncbi:MAG: SLC13 family permease [Bacteroidia bacterium]|nr:SLC13 family permease [Bacteroidia bacterium]